MRKIFVFVFVFTSICLFAQEKPAYTFSKISDVKATSVKDQQNAGTCWSYATTSFLESEALRITGKVHDLSEMYFVRFTYMNKADAYVRVHGKGNFSQGGQAHDAINVVKTHGIVPEEHYKGLNYGEKEHMHGELEDAMKGFLDGVLKKSNGKLSTAWKAAFSGILNAYFGLIPETFSYKGNDYRPFEFATTLGIVPSNYIELTSYTHIPFWKQVNLKIPDNWSGDLYYNIPLDDLIKVMEYGLKNNYSIVWDGDVSERNFSHSAGIAIIPIESWSEISRGEAKNKFNKYQKEKEITEALRQETFDNFQTTDDHLMHITGLYKDQEGAKYYKTKNSWGEESNDFGGYVYMSESFIKLKTVAILIHKDGIPDEIKKKLGI